jgi:Ca2+-binding EF-hand superfamily protein
VYKYLQYVGVSKVEYSQELGEKKFTKYDYNGNGSISLQEFRDILKNDSECRTWMQVLGFAK